MNISVSELLVRFLERLGIDHIFGMPGAHILPVYDALYDSPVRTVLVKHEQGAAFMAGGYARATGRIGACIATAGPGATNLVTGVANAFADRLPLLILTGETSTPIFGRGGLQESSGEGGSIDQSALFQGITRYHCIVERVDYLPQVLNRAARILCSDQPGPVVLSFPFNVQQESLEAALLERVAIGGHVRTLHDNDADLEALAGHLERARRPVIVAGYGCLRAEAGSALARLSREQHIPVVTTLKAKGVVDERAELSLGTLGVTSNDLGYRYIVDHADLLLFLGAGFNERTSYLWDERLLNGKTLIQVDLDYEQLNKVYRADLAIQGDVHQVLRGLLRRLGGRKGKAETLAALREFVDRRDHGAYDAGLVVTRARFPLVARFFERLGEAFADDALIFDDNILFAQNFLTLTGGARYFPNSGISALGHAIPAAIGARFAQSRPTFAILGDGGFQMCCMELMTAVNYGLPLNVVVFNNGTMGLIRKNQAQRYDGRYIGCDFVNPDFRTLAAAFGIGYRRIDDEAGLAALFREEDLRNGIRLIELPIDKDDFPNYRSGR